MFALIDCNNFYASCERLFRPDLRFKPIVVLSNNDGCVIARSNEAKDLGIKMGDPFFQIKQLVKKHQISTFSSNYTLYGDLSQRIMSVIEENWPEVEIYSIDEAFLDLSSLPKSQIEPFCSELQKKILRYTGIPTSIGIGKTKTLAKVANFIAKKKLKISVFDITEHMYWLSSIEIEAVWGIGYKWAKKLNHQGIHTAQDLASTDPHLIKKQYNVVMMRTAMELQGVACQGIEEVQPKQSIMSSKSFGVMQTEFSALAQAISSYCARACEKARAQQLIAHRVYVFVRSNPFRDDLTQYAKSIEYRLVNPTSDTRIITQVAKRCLKKLYKKDVCYKKVGVMLDELVPAHQRQHDLFNSLPESSLIHSDALMSVMDKINNRFGGNVLKLAAEGDSKTGKMRAELRSPCYTTRWSELPVVF